MVATTVKPHVRELYLEIGGIKYRLSRMGSIFTSRNGKEDCSVQVRSKAHGARQSDGYLYNTVAMFAAESGDVIRAYERLPAELSHGKLRELGFLD